MPLLRFADDAVEQMVVWLDERRLGGVVRVGCAVAIVLIPAAQSMSKARSPAWLAPVLAAFDTPLWLVPLAMAVLLLIPLERYRGGAPLRQLVRNLGRINGSFAGSLFSYSEKIAARKKRVLDDADCEILCAGLLHRIRDYTAFALGVTTAPRLRATLAVPFAGPAGEVEALRVWCYDETHDDRGFSVFPLEVNGKVVPGAPAAYLSESLQIIDDLRRVPDLPEQRTRPYRSILCMPVPVRGNNGRPLAVVSVDANEPGFFDWEGVSARVYPLVSPVLSAIGLVLSSRLRKESPYVFPR